MSTGKEKERVFESCRENDVKFDELVHVFVALFCSINNVWGSVQSKKHKCD